MNIRKCPGAASTARGVAKRTMEVLDIGKRIRHCCKDCGITTGMDWWHATYANHCAPHGCRCHNCYLTYTRRKQTDRLSGRTNKTPWVMASYPLGPPKPFTGRWATCPDCGVERIWHGQSDRCASCTVTNALARRGKAMARRVAAEQRGDKGIHWRAVAERDGWDCHLCGEPVKQVPGGAKSPKGATVDHLIPICEGGTHTWNNVALAHRWCNISRGTRGLVQLRLTG